MQGGGVALLIEKFKGLRVEKINNKKEITIQPFNRSTVKLRKQCAFTLAELLITLAIVGVVAALTLPTLISKIQDRQNIVKWRKEYSVIMSVYNKVLSENISLCDKYHATYGYCEGSLSEKFVDVFMQSVKISDACGTAANTRLPVCSSEYSWVGIAGNDVRSFYVPLGFDNSINFPLNAYNFRKYAFLLADGAVVYFGNTWNGPWIVIDVNNFTGAPNVIGRDVFAIQFYSNKKTNINWAKPLGAKGTASWNVSEHGASGCAKDIGLQKGNAIYEVAGAGCSAKYIYGY